MLVSDDLEALEKARFWATQARDTARHYQHSEVGYNYRMSNVLAGIGRGQLRVLNDRIQARREVFGQYRRAFESIEGISFMPEADYGRSTRWLTAITVDERVTGVSSTEIVDRLAAQNIEARPVWKPLHLQPLFEGCAYYPHEEEISVSDRLFSTGLCLPSGSSLTPADQNRVMDMVLHTIAIPNR